MAVPSRAFVGILVFALICTLTVIPYTVLILAGYQPPPEAPHEALFPEPEANDAGVKLVLVLASAFCVALLVAGWRGLVAGARVDRQLRAERNQSAKADVAPSEVPAGQRRLEDEPPGYQ